MTIAYITAVVCLIGTSFAAVRATRLGPQSGWLVRFSLWIATLLWVFLMAGFWDVGRSQGGEFFWRQWLVAMALDALVLLQIIQAIRNWFNRDIPSVFDRDGSIRVRS